MGVRGAKRTRPMSLFEAPMTLKAAKDSQGCLRPQGARGASGARQWARGAKEPPGETFTT